MWVSVNTCATRCLIWLEPYFTGTCLRRCLTNSVMDPAFEVHGLASISLSASRVAWMHQWWASPMLDFRLPASLKSGITCIMWLAVGGLADTASCIGALSVSHLTFLMHGLDVTGIDTSDTANALHGWCLVLSMHGQHLDMLVLDFMSSMQQACTNACIHLYVIVRGRSVWVREIYAGMEARNSHC
jgi:hypothetical protein